MLSTAMYRRIEHIEAELGSWIFFSNCDFSPILYIVGKRKNSTFQKYFILMVMRFVASTTLLERSKMK